MRESSAARVAMKLIQASDFADSNDGEALRPNLPGNEALADTSDPDISSDFACDFSLLASYGIRKVTCAEDAQAIARTIDREDLPPTEDRVELVKLLRKYEELDPLHSTLRNWIQLIPADKPVPTDLAIRGAESFREQRYPSEAVTLIDRALRWSNHETNSVGILHTQRAANLLNIFEIHGTLRARAEAWKSIKEAQSIQETPHLIRVKRRYGALWAKKRRAAS